ncbi:MAG: aminoacyl-tRNA hydrolase [Nocardioidaceae bacterium]|nr:aminoacyl-tRNA hydrolase [Nocardioidaceae bacterium]
MDLIVPAGPGLPGGLLIPDSELIERFSRSPGPGGQSVNTSDTRVELFWDPARSAVLNDGQRDRLLARAGEPLAALAHRHRSQHRNRLTAREQLGSQIRELLAPPPPARRKTRPTRGSKERRLEAKKQRGRTKQLRGRVRD